MILITQWSPDSIESPLFSTYAQWVRIARENHLLYVILIRETSDETDFMLTAQGGIDSVMTRESSEQNLVNLVKVGSRILSLERNLIDEIEKNELLYRRLKQDAEAGAKVQKKLLPEASVTIPGMKIAHLFRPCEDLAGDIYNVFRIDDEHCAVFLADVSGHGVAASLISVMISEFIFSIASFLRCPHSELGAGESWKILLSPAELIYRLNEQVCQDLDDDRFVTMAYGVVDFASGKFNYISAGHPGIIHLPFTGGVYIGDSTGPPLGVDADASFQECSLNVKPGDRLFIYSDGITEARRNNSFFGEESLTSTLRKARFMTLDDSLAFLLESLRDWVMSESFTDDISIIGMEIENSSE
jgi:sigma-B regulation protein RsbU (phosphoserine phosphatase)